MMSVIWLILKIIVFLLLTLVSLFILVFIGLVFLPIAYDLEYYKGKSFHCIVAINAFKIIKIFYKLTDEGGTYTVRLLGKTLVHSPVGDEEPPQELSEDTKRVEDVDIKSAQVVENKLPVKRIKVGSGKASKQKQEYRQEKQKVAKEKPKIKEKKLKVNEEKAKASKRNLVQDIKGLWQDPNRKVFVREVYKLLKSWVKAIKPKSCFFHLVIGREDPADTGQLIAKLALLYPWYCQYGMVSGNYTEEGLWGEARVKGKFAIKSLIKPLVVFFWQKRVREYIHTLLEVRKDD